ERLTALDALPVVLLPVRLEARYVRISDAPSALRIRVYPDQVHVDGHQPLLTDGEAAAGQTYWRNRWGAGEDAAARPAAGGAGAAGGGARRRPPPAAGGAHRAGHDADERATRRPAVPVAA